MKRLIAALLLCLLPSLAQAASCSSYPFTLQNNTTADATQVMANFNTVRNCVINNAAGSGVNTDITALTALTTPLSPAQGGTPVFIGVNSTGSANAQVVSSTTPTPYSLISGYRVTFTAGFTNTGATTLNVGGSGATAVNRLGHGGPEALTGGEIVVGNMVEAIYNGSVFILLTSDLTGAGTRTNIAGAATTDLGTVPTHNAAITGSGATITSFGSSAVATDPIYLISFAGANTLTYNATSLLIPGLANITTAAGDTAVVEYLGGPGNWQVLSYTRSSGGSIVVTTPLPGAVGYVGANNAGTPNTSYDMAASFVTMLASNGVSVTAVNASVTINATVVGANGLDAGALAIGTPYNVFWISNGTTTAGLMSTSATAPVMPTGYIYKVRIGAIFTNSGAATFQRIRQTGNVSQYLATVVVPPNLVNGTAGSTYSTTNPVLVSLSLAAFAPPTAVAVNIAANSNWTGSAQANVLVAPSQAYSGVGNGPQGANGMPFSIYLNGGGGGSQIASAWIQLESLAVSYASSAAGGALNVLGWKDAVNAN